MSAFVVDASVAVKWFLPEIHAADALRLLSGAHTLFAPDLLFPEVGNTLWKRVQRSEATLEQAQATLEALEELPLAVQPSRPLMPVALEIAAKARRSVYDALYLAVAVFHRCPLVTADQKLHRALRTSPMSPHLVWVGDVE